jgi:hypothetical protein
MIVCRRFNRPYGTCVSLARHYPPMNRWAKLKHPYGAGIRRVCPSLPVQTPEEFRGNIRESICFHLDGRRENGIPAPQWTGRSCHVGAWAARVPIQCVGFAFGTQR